MLYIFDFGFVLILCFMCYFVFYEMYKNVIKNIWMVDEVDFLFDIIDLCSKMSEVDCYLIYCLVVFFVIGDMIVLNNLVLNLYQYINVLEVCMYLLCQFYEEVLYVQFYFILLDIYIFDLVECNKVFVVIENIFLICVKGEFCFCWIDLIQNLQWLEMCEYCCQFLFNLICFVVCIEGLFFYVVFVYVYFLCLCGLLYGLVLGINWVFCDEFGYMVFVFEVVCMVCVEEFELFDDVMCVQVEQMLEEVIVCEIWFVEDVFFGGVVGLLVKDMCQYLEYVVDQCLVQFDLLLKYGMKNLFDFMDLQDVQEVINFFEWCVLVYQVGVQGEVVFDMVF